MADVKVDVSKDFEALRADFEALKLEMDELKLKAKEKVADLGTGSERLSAQLRKLLEKSGDATQSVAQTAEQQMSKNPLLSLLGALGVGFILAKITDRR